MVRELGLQVSGFVGVRRAAAAAARAGRRRGGGGAGGQPPQTARAQALFSTGATERQSKDYGSWRPAEPVVWQREEQNELSFWDKA